MCNNQGTEKRKGRFVKEGYRRANVICRKSRKRNIPQAEEFPFPYDPSVPYEDNCLMQED